MTDAVAENKSQKVSLSAELTVIQENDKNTSGKKASDTNKKEDGVVKDAVIPVQNPSDKEKTSRVKHFCIGLGILSVAGLFAVMVYYTVTSVIQSNSMEPLRAIRNGDAVAFLGVPDEKTIEINELPEEWNNLRSTDSLRKNNTTSTDMMTSDESVPINYVIVPRTATFVFSVIGVVLNILVLYVVGKEKSKTSTEIFLMEISVVDISHLITSSIDRGIELYNAMRLDGLIPGKEYKQSLGVLLLFIKLFLPLQKTISIVIMVAFAVERNYAVYKPFTFRETFTVRLVKKLNIALFSILAVIAFFMMIGIHFVPSMYTYIVLSLIAACILTASNIATLVKLRERRTVLKTFGVNSPVHSERKQTKILVGISLMFVATTVFQSLAMITQIFSYTAVRLESFRGIITYNTYIGFYLMQDLDATIQCINSALNGVLFVALNDRYKNQFFRILKCGMHSP